VDINRTSETIRENIKTSAKDGVVSIVDLTLTMAGRVLEMARSVKQTKLQ